jgi:hypothetical protein
VLRHAYEKSCLAIVGGLFHFVVRVIPHSAWDGQGNSQNETPRPLAYLMLSLAWQTKI